MKGGSIWTRNSRADGLDGRWLACGLIDRYDQASRLGNLTGLALFLAAVAWFMTYPLFFAETVVPLDDPFQITVEILDLPPPQPEPEEILREPEPVPPPEPAPPPEPEEITPEIPEEPVPPPPEPVPAETVPEKEIVEPPPKPKPKPAPKPTPKPAQATRTLERPPAVPSEAPTVAPAASKGERDKFLSELLRMVEKNKFYPREARRENLSGTVKVRASFDEAGRIRSLSLVPGDYNPILGQAALTVMDKVKSRWKGRAGAPDSVVIPIAFKLRN